MTAGRGSTAGRPALARRLGVGDAVLIGLGSMMGAGVFAVFTPAARAAGAGLLIGLAVAGVVAFCNATSSAQLAAQYPVAGGTYHYGREQLGEWWGFFAGWGFVVGKTASAAAMALTFATYVTHSGWSRVLAAGALAVLALVNCRGITRTAQLTRVLVTLVFVGLAVVLVAASVVPGPAEGLEWTTGHGAYGVLQSAGLLFFAFAGYARIATLGEEVRDPVRTIPRAIVIALSIAVVLYAAVAVVLLRALGSDGVAATPTPLTAAVRASNAPALAHLVPVVAAIASLGALLALIAGIGRTTLAMARNRDLPHLLATVDERYRVPQRAELTVAVIAIGAVLVVDLRGVIGFSSFGVLLYYGIANLAALRQRGPHRRYPHWLQVVGAVMCAALVVTLPWPSVVGGVAVFIFGVAYRLATSGHRRDLRAD